MVILSGDVSVKRSVSESLVPLLGDIGLAYHNINVKKIETSYTGKTDRKGENFVP